MTLAHAAVDSADIWSAWRFDPIVVASLILAAGTYAAGVRRLWSGDARRGVRARQVVSFYFGLVLITLALLSPLEALAGALVSGHMAQHLVFLVPAPALLVYSAPGLVLTTALPVRVRQALNGVRQASLVAFFSGAFAAVAIHSTAMWVWHLPGPYEAAVENELLHGVEHVSFLLTALLFWAVVIQPRPRRRVTYPVALLGAFVVWMLSGGLGALLSFSSQPLYPVLSHHADAWGISSLGDQQLAGAVMWVPAGFAYLVAMGALFVRWMESLERTMRRRDAPPDANVPDQRTAEVPP